MSRAATNNRKARDARSSLSTPMQVLIRALARQTVAEQRERQQGDACSGNATQKKRAA